MTFKNITENAVLNAAGRLVDPGSEIFMPVEYYAKHKGFVDRYVEAKKAEIGGLDEYKKFLEEGEVEEKKDEKVDLMEEVLKEESENKEVKEEPKAEEEKKEPKKEEEKKEAPKKKTTARRRKPAAKAAE